MHHSMYTRITVTNRYGPVTLTIFTFKDAMWIHDQIMHLPDNLHGVQSGIINVGASFIVIEREPYSSELRFLCQSYRPVSESDDELYAPELTVFDYYPTTHWL